MSYDPPKTYETWYPDVPPVLTTRRPAGNHDPRWTREGVVPAHRRLGGRKFMFLRHEVFEWLDANRFRPEGT
jgi:hypothetical protein